MKEEISFFASEPSKCGLEVFVRTKTEPLMKKMAETESGTSLMASGWHRVCLTAGGSWSCPSRPREDKAPTCRKVRWEADL